MEKQVKMSLETAREWYELAKENEISGKTNPAIKFLEENFTKEELEGKKGFTWEESFDGGGWYIGDGSDISAVTNGDKDETNKDVFKTKAQAKSALAFAQLSHIVAKYNEGKKFGDVVFCVRRGPIGLYTDAIHEIYVVSQLPFATQQDAQISMEVNRQLWLDYWMIEEKK